MLYAIVELPTFPMGLKVIWCIVWLKFRSCSSQVNCIYIAPYNKFASRVFTQERERQKRWVLSLDLKASDISRKVIPEEAGTIGEGPTACWLLYNSGDRQEPYILGVESTGWNIRFKEIRQVWRGVPVENLIGYQKHLKVWSDIVVFRLSRSMLYF